MASHGKVTEEPKRRRPPATTPEARELQMISLAVDVAEKQLLSGNVSSQVLSHFLKLATVRERKELEILEQKRVLMQAQAEALNDTKANQELYGEVLRAMRTYSGRGANDED